MASPWQGAPGRKEIVGDCAETEQYTPLRNDRQNSNWPEKLLTNHSAIGPLEVKYSSVGDALIRKFLMRFAMIVVGLFFQMYAL